MVSYSVFQNVKQTRRLVLILVVMEDGLVHGIRRHHSKRLEVLILVVMEDGLVHFNNVADYKFTKS